MTDWIEGQATIQKARAEGGRDESGEGESGSAVTDFMGLMWGTSRWELLLHVEVPGWQPYAVQGWYKVPNKLGPLRKNVIGQRRLKAGLVVPVRVAANDASRLEIDWKRFVDSGAVKQLDGPGFLAGVRDLAKDVRSLGDTTPTPTFVPRQPRPTPATHPPIEGVDFDRYLAAVAELSATKPHRAEHEACYQRHGFPPGRGETIAAAWFHVVQRDIACNEWYRATLRV